MIKNIIFDLSEVIISGYHGTEKIIGGNTNISEEDFEKRLYNDKLKLDLCTEHGIKMIYYSDLGIDYPYEVIEDLDKILQIILGQ